MFLFVIDTEQYAGNFERQMCAYLTGKIGECHVGSEYTSMFEKECAVEFNNVIDQPDEHGCYRPVVIYPTPGWFNDGMGNHYKENADPKKVIRKYKQTCKKVKYKIAKSPGEYPAYLSVAIFFSPKPFDEQITVMKERAAKFITLKNHKFDDFTKIKITGFRLIKREVKETEITI